MKKNLTYVLLLMSFICFGNTVKVTRIIDGDTFETEKGEKVRLIGINAPEITDIFGYESKKYLSKLIENKTIELRSDDISNDRDRYQRLLRYVIINGVDINEKMVSEGFAFAYLKYKFSKSNVYEKAQIESRENNRGIWGGGEGEVFINEKIVSSTTFWQNLSPKAYFVGLLVLILMIFGLYNYFKK